MLRISRFFNILLVVIFLTSLFPTTVSASVARNNYTGDETVIYPIEIEAARTEFSKTIDLGGGRKTLNISSTPEFYKDDYSSKSEVWKPIDLTLVNGSINTAPYYLSIDEKTLTVLFRDKKTNHVTTVQLVSLYDTKITPSISDFKYTLNNRGIKLDLPHLSTIKITQDRLDSSISIVHTPDKVYATSSELDRRGNVISKLIKPTILTSNYQVKSAINISASAYSDYASVTGLGHTNNYAYMYVPVGDGEGVAVGYYNDGVNEYTFSFGIRFLGVTIPSGATINSANLSLMAYVNRSSTTVNAVIHAQQTSNATTFTIDEFDEVADWNGRSQTTSSVAWSNITAWVSGNTYSTPDIKTLIDELVTDYTGLSASSVVVFVEEDLTSTLDGGVTFVERVINVYDSSTGEDAHLLIDYTAAAATPPTVATLATSEIQETYTVGGGNITALGTSAYAQAWGVQYDVDTGSPYASNITTTGNVTTVNYAYSSNMSVLSSATKYFYRAFAYSPKGYGYGSELTYLTKPDAPTGVTGVAGNGSANITWTKATPGSGITMWTVVRYDTAGYPTNPNSGGTLAYNGTANSYTKTGLTNGTPYYFSTWSLAYNADPLSHYSDLTATVAVTPATTPTVTTHAATSIEETTATGSGNITATGGANAYQRGFQRGTSTGTYTANVTESASYGTGAFTTPSITGMVEATKYFYRAFAVNSAGQGSGTEYTFLTKPLEPTGISGVAGDHSANITWTKAAVGAGITMWTVVRYSSVAYPTNPDSSGTLAYNGTASTNTTYSLTNGTPYYFRIWSLAYNADPLSHYSDTYSSVTVTPGSVPIVTTHTATGLTTVAATGSGNITDVGGANAYQRGFQYDVDTGVPYASNVTEVASYGTGAFTTPAITGLTAATKYFYRAFAVNPSGQASGAEYTFLTFPATPTGISGVAGSGSANITWTKAATGAGITMWTVVRYSSVAYPTNPDADGTLAYNGTASSYTKTGLTNGTPYYFRAWSLAYNADPLSHYSVTTANVTVTPYAAPTVTTHDATGMTTVAATGSGNITNVGGSNAYQRGFQIGTVTTTYTSNYTEVASYSTGAFTTPAMTGLTAATKYYYRAFAVNVGGQGSGAEYTFLTIPNPPTGISGVAGDHSANITWTKATGGAGITIYTVVRYSSIAYPTEPNASGTLAYNGTAESNTTYSLTGGIPYYFRAWTLAYNADPLSHYSTSYESVTVTPLSAPTVTSNWFTGLGRDFAVLNGAVTNAGGATVTQTGFQYGLTSAYGSNQTKTDSMMVARPFYQNMTGLLPATVYHYRAIAYNGLWGYGEDMTFSTKGSPVIYENYQTGGDSYGNNTAMGNITFQTFTTNSTAHTITSVKVYVFYHSHNSSELELSIKHTAGGIPTGDALISHSVDSYYIPPTATWVDFDFSDNDYVREISLEPNTTYAIVLKGVNMIDVDSYYSWYWDGGGGFANGNAGFSSDDGVTYESYAGDYLFQIWGNPVLEVVNAKVFRSYLTSGDWLVTCMYKNIYPPYYTDNVATEKDVSSLFNLQLISNTGSVIASTKVAQWEYNPGSIYFSPSAVALLTWGSTYRVRMQGNFGTLPYAEYELQAADWIGSDLTKLDSYLISQTTPMYDWYAEKYFINPNVSYDSLSPYVPKTNLVKSVTGQGQVFGVNGGVAFNTGIPQLSKVRPNLFGVAASQGMPNTIQTWTNALQGQYIWQAQLGPEMTTTLTLVGSILNVEGKIAGMILCFILYLLIAAVTFPRGHVVAGLVMSFPVLLAGAWTGLIDLAVVGVVTFIMVALLMFYLWWRNAY
jgi:hypothetical protein